MGIKLSEVAFTYRYSKKKMCHYAIQNINLNIANNDEFICIVGHTGSGKSTLVQSLNSLVVPTNGHIEVDFNDEQGYLKYDILN